MINDAIESLDLENICFESKIVSLSLLEAEISIFLVIHHVGMPNIQNGRHILRVGFQKSFQGRIN